MWDTEKKDFIAKFLNSLLIGLFIGSTVKYIRNRSRALKKEIKLIHKKETRLILRKVENYSKEFILQLGRSSIRCPLSNTILVNPVVSINGTSYSKIHLEGYIQEFKKYPSGQAVDETFTFFENRILKEFIDKCVEIYNIPTI